MSPLFPIHTPRLLISHLDPSNDSHCDLLVTLYDTPANRAHQPVASQVRDHEAARRNITANKASIEASGGYGRYLVSLKAEAGERRRAKEFENGAHSDNSEFRDPEESIPIGTIGLKTRKFSGAPSLPDMGYAMHPSHQGKGYATEAANALLKYFEEAKGQTQFLAYCDESNEGSKKVLRRAGFEEWGVRTVRGLYADGVGIEACVFSRGVGDLDGVGL